MTCANSSIYVVAAGSNLNRALVDTLTDIKTQLYPFASFIKPTPGEFVYSDYGIRKVIAAGSNRLSEFDPILFDMHFGGGKRGLYSPKNGRIFVRKNTWCRHTLIHETLHSVSTFAAQNNFKQGFQYSFINEGLTELLAGYILWKHYPDCYVTWSKRLLQTNCTSSLSYNKMTRIWYTFCRFIPFNSVNELYFNDLKLPWNVQWNNFLNSIEEVGYTFNDPLVGTGILEDRFLYECKRSFGVNEVEKIYENDSHDFDFSKLIII